MLETLLHWIEQGGAYSLSDLAHALDVSPTLVEQMLADLERLGRLRRLEGCALGRCGKCSFAQSCASSAWGKMWVAEKASGLDIL